MRSANGFHSALAPYWSGLGGTLPAPPAFDIHPHDLMGLAALSSAQVWSEMLPLALPAGLSLAAISAVDTLMSIAYLETLDGKRVEPNRVLRGLGVANLGSAFAMLLIVILTLVLGLIPAIALGLLVSTIFIVMNNSRSVIASVQRGNERRSLVVRTPAEKSCCHRCARASC